MDTDADSYSPPRSDRLAYRIEVVDSIANIDRVRWNALCPDDQPFVSHEFHHALEANGCISPAQGWHCRHLILTTVEGDLVAAMPLYLKDHSWGEFVFDFAWAQAYARAGLPYYPKLVSMCPFTPVTGRRILSMPGHPDAPRILIRAALEIAQQSGVSSLHVLFPRADEMGALENESLLPRRDIRFMWTNPGFTIFEDFLALFSAAKRKKIRRERRRVTEQGIIVKTHAAAELNAAEWQAVYDLCALTFNRRGNEPYLSLDFFLQLRETISERLLVNVARHDGQIVGAAILFRDSDTLYGRYWGGLPGYDCLHFETCYYRGIEYCIEHRLTSFDPGTQGEHKFRRGFAPTTTWSAHWIAEPAFRKAIASYLAAESAQVLDYHDELQRHLPFRTGT